MGVLGRNSEVRRSREIPNEVEDLEGVYEEKKGREPSSEVVENGSNTVTEPLLGGTKVDRKESRLKT